MKKATYKEIPELISNKINFQGNSLTAYTDPQNKDLYIIMSYRTVIATVDRYTCKLNTEYYSNTTSRQQNIIKRCYPNYLEVSHEELNGYSRY